MPIVASSQLTLTDVYDSKQYTFSIRPTRQTSVVFDGVSVYQPDYASSPQELVPEISVSGEVGLLSSGFESCTWTKQLPGQAPVPVPDGNPAYGLSPIGTSGLSSLIVSENPVSGADLVSYEATIVYRDPILGEILTLTATCDIRRITNGVAGVNAITLNLTNDSATLSADPDGLVSDYSSMQTELEVLSGTTNVTGSWTITTEPSTGVTGVQTGPTYQVTNMEVDDGTVLFRAEKDGQIYEKWFSVSKIRRGEDAYRVEVQSSQGNIFKNGAISTELSARLYKGDTDITDTVAAQYFVWTRASSDPVADQAWNFSHASGRKTITISPTDVYVRATFNCQVTKF